MLVLGSDHFNFGSLERGSKKFLDAGVNISAIGRYARTTPFQIPSILQIPINIIY